MNLQIPPAQLRTMLEMQCRMNFKVHPEWHEQDFAWHRAIMVEGAEAMEHHGWKWWKKQEIDLEQLQMELVDIWHFGMSLLVTRFDGDIGATAYVIEQAVAHDLRSPSGDILEQLDILVGAAAHKQFQIGTFLGLLTACGMTTDDLYQQYVGKNVLNFFRQDHGYKDGTYQKVWDDREDNAHLTEIMARLDSEHPEFPEFLYKALENRYLALTQPQKETA